MVGMPDSLQQLANLPAEAFRKADPSPDAAFYRQPRFVTHIDDGAIAAVTAVYREVLPADGDILDLMSSWVSHLPPEVQYRSVTGLGMNEAELAANPRLTTNIVQDLNADPALPFADGAFDGAGLCVSVQYLQRPVEVFRDVRRTLRPGRRSWFPSPTAVSRARRWRSGRRWTGRTSSAWWPPTCGRQGSTRSKAGRACLPAATRSGSWSAAPPPFCRADRRRRLSHLA